MSKRKPPVRSLHPPRPSSTGQSGSKRADREASGRAAPRRWAFRFLALTVIPLLLLALLELGLRLGDYGYPTGYFLKRELAGRTVLTENHRFGHRFFPSGLVRSPRPFLMETPKPAGTFRIFVLGESAAMGDPEPAFGFSRFLEVLLLERFPQAHFEIINVAMTAINSHAILPIARECAQNQGDLWIVYMGNNEVEGPFGAGTVFGPKAPSLAFIRASLFLKSTRTGQWLDAVRGKFANDPFPGEEWRGLKMFLEHQVRQDDPHMETVYRHFARNLADIVDLGRNAGAKILLGSVASNLRDCAPFASLHSVRLSDSVLPAWKNLYDSGSALQAAGKWKEALDLYGQAAQVDSQYAELHFRMGQCELALGEGESARKSFAQARDLDTLRFRADSRLNQILEEIARRNAGRDVLWVDAAERFSQSTTNRIPGQEFFFEHVHLNEEGNYLLARAFAEGALKLLPETMTKAAQGDWASAERCARRLGLTDWNRLQVHEAIRRRLLDAPFTNQLNHATRDQMYQSKIAEFRLRLKPEALKQAQETYRAALETSPQDHFLHEKFARLLEAAGDPAGALRHWQRVRELLPQYPLAGYEMAKLLEKQGKSAEAQQCLAQAIELRGDFLEALNDMGMSLVKQRKFPEGMDYFARALRVNPRFSDTYINLGLALISQRKTNEAAARFDEALKIKPDSMVAHLHLANLLTDQGQLPEAASHYSAIVRLQPQNAFAHFNLANSLSDQKKTDAALASYREAVRLKPDFVDARYKAAEILVGQGQYPAAAAELAEVVRLRPNHVRAHVNLGAALAKQNLNDQALEHFREALRLDPSSKAAQQNIEALQSKRPE